MKNIGKITEEDKLSLKNLRLKYRKWEAKKEGDMLNYPSKGVALIILAVVLWSTACTFFLSAMFFDCWRGDALSKIGAVLLLSIVSLLFGYTAFRYIYKPFKHYENRYGKTGLGDKFIKKWGSLNE